MQADLCIIVAAAGLGARFGGKLPKQYMKLGEHTVIEHTLMALRRAFPTVTLIVTLHPEDRWFHLLDLKDEKICPIVGGLNRSDSVWNGLEYLKAKDKPPAWVMVHDAARPCILVSDLHKLVKGCFHKPPGGVLAIPSTDTLKQVQHDNVITKTINRNTVWRALTPQMFEFKKLHVAYERARASKIEITDESSAMEFAGYTPHIIEGNPMNIKITYPHDLFIAEHYLALFQHKETQSA